MEALEKDFLARLLGLSDLPDQICQEPPAVLTSFKSSNKHVALAILDTEGKAKEQANKKTTTKAMESEMQQKKRQSAKRPLQNI